MSASKADRVLREASQALLDTVAWYLTRTGVSAADAGLLGVMEDLEAALRPHGGEEDADAQPV